MKLLTLKNLVWVGLVGAVLAASAQPARISIAADQPGHRIPATLWGVFFEDINLSADGGIYPELVRNRSFEDGDKPDSWKFANAAGGRCACAIDSTRPLNAVNRQSLRIALDGAFTLANEGYWGMNIVKDQHYTLRLAARAEAFPGPLTARLVTANGHELAAGEITGLSGDWKYQTLELVATDSDPRAALEISASGKGVLYLDMVSLLPKQTWKDHGLRPDLAEAIQALKPSFMRFPGGCWVEGETRARMYNWKRTIGNLDSRVPLWNIWGYNATHGLGYYEYLQLAEDLGAAPLFCVNVGMSHKETVPMDQMAQWVQDALDAIEYANGGTHSAWGARRAEAGHPEPFNLKYLEIGNENGGPPYAERWPLFVNAIRAKYPDLKLVADHWLGGYPTNPMPDIVDEHFYDSPEWFMRQATHFDKYDRKGPKTFVGEYAVTRNCGLGNLRGALGEAAFMTGLERNSDQVIMASYAPLLVNLNHRAWNPDLINFDSSRWYGLPSYYVQKLFAENRGDISLPTTVDAPRAERETPRGMIGVGTWNTAAEFRNVKVAAPDGKVLLADDLSHGTDRWKFLGGGDWKVADGALRQTAEKEFIRALAGDRNWTDYTLTLQARKISGAEGFLVLFRIRGDEDRIWWNIGGWGNTADAIEAGDRLGSKPDNIESGRWYDLKVVVTGNHVQCYRDGKLEHDVDYDLIGDVTSLYAVTAKDKKTGDLILKVVNVNPRPLETEIKLEGATNLTGKGTARVLTSADATDENSLDNPAKVSPVTVAVTFSGTSLRHSFPGNSFSVLRLKTALQTTSLDKAAARASDWRAQ
jgi:alpha-L-arabinofuranosidase